MSHTPILALPDFTEPFWIETDACATRVGAVVMPRRAVRAASHLPEVHCIYLPPPHHFKIQKNDVGLKSIFVTFSFSYRE
jgi:hypothetical protein